MITIPTPFPYGDTKEVPWIYDSTVYIHGQRVQEEPLTVNEPTMNITRIGGVTMSGRIFASVTPITDNVETSSQDKGKQVKNHQQRHDSPPISEVKEFLRIIKKNNYKVVDQLN